MLDDDDRFLEEIDRQSKQRKLFEMRGPFWRHTVYSGVLGVIFILPVVVGAYLGRWLDENMSGYSVSWTVNLILIGIVIGAVNVYLFVRDRM